MARFSPTHAKDPGRHGRRGPGKGELYGADQAAEELVLLLDDPEFDEEVEEVEEEDVLDVEADDDVSFDSEGEDELFDAGVLLDEELRLSVR